MARDLVTVHEGTLDITQSIAVAEITKTAIAVNNGATLVGITGVKDNSHALVVETTAATALTFKAGELQNNVQGDQTVTLEANKTYYIDVERLTRFCKKNGDIDVDFGGRGEGTTFILKFFKWIVSKWQNCHNNKFFCHGTVILHC